MSGASEKRLEIFTRDLSGRIVSGQWPPGFRLPTEQQLQKQWGISRSVVREAMKVLASQGLVRIEQGRGSFVSEATAAPLREQLSYALQRARHTSGEARSTPDESGDWAQLQEVRRVLEVAVAESAAARVARPMRAATRREISAHLEAMQNAIEQLRERPDEPAGYVDADLEFHRALALTSGNALWPALLGSLNELLRRYREVSFRGSNSALTAARQHQKILNAVRAGDSLAARAAMQSHLRRSERDLKEPLKETRAE